VVDKLQLSRSKTEDACEMARHNPAEKPDINRIAEIKDQWIRGKIYWSLEYVAQN
jgi:GTP-binding protein LepA